MITAEEKDNRYGYHYVYYRCTKKRRNVNCGQRYINLRDLEAQILEFLGKIYVPERLLDLAVDYLRDEEREENGKYFDIQKSLKKALGDCRTKLDNLNQMRLKDLIDDDEYLGEKKKLIEEKIKFEESLKNGNGNGNRRATQLTKKRFIFANRAKDRFQNGSLEEKRSILHELGSNFSLSDKKLTILIEKLLLIIEEGLKGVNGRNCTLEPQKSGPFERERELSLSKIQSWCATVEDVRTFYLRNQ